MEPWLNLSEDLSGDHQLNGGGATHFVLMTKQYR